MMTDDIKVEKLGAEFFALAAAWLTDPEINQWLYSEWRERPITEQLLGIVSNNPKNRIWLIIADGRPYGLCCISSISTIDRSGILWYLRGSGIGRIPDAMTRAVGMVIREAFSEFGLCSINASILEPNAASRRILEKSGFHYAGRLRHAFLVDGRPVDRILFDIIPNDLKG